MEVICEMSVKRLCLIGLASACLSLSFPQDPAEAADLPGTTQYQGTTEGGLSFTIVPFYGWVPGMNAPHPENASAISRQPRPSYINSGVALEM